jgi:hypothetical protein
MQERKKAALFLEIFIIVAILVILAAIVVPKLGPLLSKGKVEETPEPELHNIPTPMTERLPDNFIGTVDLHDTYLSARL